MRSTGIVRTASSGSRYSASVASSPASVILSARTARAIGCSRQRATAPRRPTMQPACGPPSSLSPLKSTRSAPASRASATRGSPAQAPGGEIGQKAAPDVHQVRDCGVPAERGDVGRAGRGDEPALLEVGAMHGEDGGDVRRRVRGDSPRGGCGWWCRPRGAGRRSAARMSGIRKDPPISISSPREIRTSRPAARALSASSSAPAALLTASASSAPVTARSGSRQWSLRLPAGAGVEIELQVAVPRGDLRHRGHGRRRERCTAEVGVQHDAGGVEHRAEARSGAVGEALPNVGRPALRRAGPRGCVRRPAIRAPRPRPRRAARCGAAPGSRARAAAGPPKEARAAGRSLGSGRRRLGRSRLGGRAAGWAAALPEPALLESAPSHAGRGWSRLPL